MIHRLRRSVGHGGGCLSAAAARWLRFQIPPSSFVSPCVLLPFPFAAIARVVCVRVSVLRFAQSHARASSGGGQCAALRAAHSDSDADSAATLADREPRKTKGARNKKPATASRSIRFDSIRPATQRTILLTRTDSRCGRGRTGGGMSGHRNMASGDRPASDACSCCRWSLRRLSLRSAPRCAVPLCAGDSLRRR